MGLFINTNQSAINAQRQLNSTTNTLSTSFERLSSGLRINGAKDDAAGLSISTRFTSQIRGLNQAVRNGNDGISLAQTAEGALNETTNILQRIRELAVQAANDTNNALDRASIQTEVTQLKDEINRISDTTNFNGNKVLDGSFLSKTVQVGAHVGETLLISVKGASTTDLARQARYDGTSFVSADAFDGSNIKINDFEIRATVDADDQYSTSLASASAIAKAAAINDISSATKVRAIVNETEVTASSAVSAITLDSSSYFSINGVKISGFAVIDNDADGALTDAVNAVSDDTGVIASLTTGGRMQLTAADGRNIEVSSSSAAVALKLTGFLATVASVAANTIVATGKITLQSDSNFEIGVANAVTLIGFESFGNGVFGVNSDKTVSSVDVTTRAGATEALDVLDLALEHVSAERARLGALQNRLASTINNLSTTSENLSGSRSRILDADFAAETARLSRNQIIQQASVSILSQANQQPQIALALL